MKININDLQKYISAASIKKAEKNKVREIDEIKTGEFVAYVDDGDETYDVSVVLSKEGDVNTTICDCPKNKTICLHKVALLLFISTKKKVKSPLKSKNKVDKNEQLLESIPHEKLMGWVKSVLKSYPDIALSFEFEFASKDHEYTVSEIQKITKDAVKSVVKNKKNIDATQLKQILSLWKIVHKPIIDLYKFNPADKKHFDCFCALLEFCMLTGKDLNSNSVKFNSYAESILNDCIECVVNILDDELWKSSIQFLIDRIHHQVLGTNLILLTHIKNLSSHFNESRKELLVDMIAKYYKSKGPGNTVFANEFTTYTFLIISENNKFEKYFHLFKPLNWSNDYNLKLINGLIGINQLELAEKYCNSEILSNYKNEYNIPYYKLLNSIYLITNEQDKRVNVLKELLLYNFQYDEFVLVSSNFKGEQELKKWRIKMITNAKHALRDYNKDAVDFLFKLYHNESKHKKIIEIISEHTPLELVLEYIETLLHVDELETLYALLKRSNSHGWLRNKGFYDSDLLQYSGLLKAILKRFTPQFIMNFIETKKSGIYWYYQKNSFFDYVQDKLSDYSE
jgi:hypothetical protein